MPRPDTSLDEPIAAMWAMPDPGPSNLLQTQEFLDLRDHVVARFGEPRSRDGLSSALWNALRSLGLPAIMPQALRARPPSPEFAARTLSEAFTRREWKRVHLCPLDLADELPSLTLGAVRVSRLSPSDLSAYVDAPRLQRWGPHFAFPVSRLAGLQWLVVEEIISHEVEPGHRALPVFYEPFPEDFARITPHEERFPPALQAALFGLISAPWETWTETKFDWRPFRIRWVYTADRDLFARPQAAPAADALSWSEWERPDGEWEESPDHVPWAAPQADVDRHDLNSTVSGAMSALARDYLQVPAPHFMVSAFTADGIDQFLHHITAIEAALGLPHDYRRPGIAKPAVHQELTGRIRVQKRIVALLNDVAAGSQFDGLFEHRSAFLHGRPMSGISGPDRVLARTLARRVMESLVAAARTSDRPREDYLEDLLKKGVILTPPASKP